MAVEYNATSDLLRNTSSTPITGFPFSVCWWQYNDAMVNDIAWVIGDASSSNYFAYGSFTSSPSGQLLASVRDTTFGTAQTSNAASTGEWAHCASIFASTTSRTSILNGNLAQKGTDISTKNAVNWDGMAIGSSIYNTTSAIDGRIAHFGIWNVALTDAEVVSLSAGAHPLTVRPGSLVSYWPLTYRANTTNPRDIVGGIQLTATSLTRVDDPPQVHYPQAQILQFPPAAAPATSAALLSHPHRHTNLGFG